MRGTTGLAALSGLRVLDLTSGIAGQYCGKLLAGFGADCVLVEPIAGTPTRNLGPRSTHGARSTRSALFRHLNQGKSAITTDPGGERIRALAALADVVIRDESSPLPRVLSAAAIECVIGEFPDSGPYAGWQGTEMIHQAMSGTMYMTGWPDREPLYGTGYRGYYATGTTAFIDVLAALHERERSGLGQTVRATVFEANAAVAQNLVSQYSYNQTYETRRQYPGFLALLRCRDHWMVLFAIRYWEQLCATFGLEHLLADERFTQQSSRLENWRAVVALMQDCAASMAASDLVAALQGSRISAEVITPLGDLITSPQWHSRRLLRRIAADSGRAGEVALGPPFTVGDTPYSPGPASPSLRTGAQAARQARATERRWQLAAGSSPADAASETRPGVSPAVAPAAGALSGLRVIDLTTAWAGPLAARSLAHLGAEVIKIDAPSHTDSWRGAPEGGAARHYPDGQQGERPWNRCVLFNTQGQGKLSLGLDLKVRGAREVMLSLAAASDVLISNFTPGVLERLGIGYADLSAVNPEIIVVEMPAFGPGGPDSAHQGMGKTMEAACGMATLMGYGDGTPVLTGPAYLDPIGGLNAVAATLTALYHRSRTGRGCRVEVPQTEAGMHWIGEQVLQQAETGTSWRPDGNSVPYAAPHDAYPCRGEDEWIAVAVSSDAQWRALCELMRRPDLLESGRYASLARRNANRHELASIIGSWTRRHGKHELALLLQAAGVPAAPVNNASDVARDEALLRSGFIRALDHPEAGRHAYPSLSYQLDRTPGGISRAAPCFGEHNEQTLVGLLGLSADRVAALVASGAVTDRPAAAVQASRSAEAAHVAQTSRSAEKDGMATPSHAAKCSTQPSSRQQPLANRGAR
jgi:crotonobetainyl-CoA:carnitine CoA-transferase CaiB-like acyl-CoA transferase